MLKNDKRRCKKLYKYYKKAFKECNELLINSTPNFLFGLETMMLYLQYMQDTIVATKSFIAEDNAKARAIFASINTVLVSYAKYKQDLFKRSELEQNTKLSKEEKDEQSKKLLEEIDFNWQIIWQTVSALMEGWILDEHIVK